MKKIEILAVCLSLWLSGCMVAPIGYSSSEINEAYTKTYMDSISPTPKIGKNYKIGETYTIDTGSTMIKIFNAYVFPEYRSKYNYQPPGVPTGSDPNYLVGASEITPAQRWRAIYSYEDNYIISCYNHNITYGILIKKNGELGNEKAWITIHNTEYSPANVIWKLPDPKLFEPIESEIIEDPENSFNAELIYTGKMGNIITVSYREYVDN